jgi:hypothetical protein
MGGTAAVSQDVEDAIRDMHIATIRVAGADRQATSVQAFNLIEGNWYKKHGTHSVIIATGANYADALSISPFAYATGTPIILTKADGTLTDEAVKAIKANDEIWQIIVVGGTSAVADSVFSALGTYNGSYKDYYNKVYIPVRIAGADRYDTSAKIADWEINFALDTGSDASYWAGTVDTSVPWWADFAMNEVFVATGENFPDALAGGQLAGGKYYAKGAPFGTVRPHSPILLTKDGNRSADAVIAQYLAWNDNVYSVDAALYANFNDYAMEIKGNALTYEQDVRTFINDYFGDFWTLSAFNIDNENLVFSIGDRTIGIINDYGRSEFNTFHGVVLGGAAAVSKAKVDQLEDTVEGTILKYYDEAALDWYHLWFNGTWKTWFNSNLNTEVVAGVRPDFGYYNNKKIIDFIPGNLKNFYEADGSKFEARADVTAGKGYYIYTQKFVGANIDVDDANYGTKDTVKLFIVQDADTGKYLASGFVNNNATVEWSTTGATATKAGFVTVKNGTSTGTKYSYDSDGYLIGKE